MGCMYLLAKTISARKMEMYVEGVVDESQGIPYIQISEEKNMSAFMSLNGGLSEHE